METHPTSGVNDLLLDLGKTKSRLGTFKHWQSKYTKELKNFHTTGDVGEVWYGEDTAWRIVEWMAHSSLISQSDSILDLGCGNGITLLNLADEGFKGLSGVDYCPEAIQLAKALAEKKGVNIQYDVGDLISMTAENDSLTWQYDVCHDKGTLDTITLNPADARGNTIKYVENVNALLRHGGLLIVTSCNWTEKEILNFFSMYFDKVETLPTALFEFGGVIGSHLTSVALRKKSPH